MQWVRARWRLLASLAVLFLVGVGVGSAGSNGGETETVVRAAEAKMTTVTETETETVEATADELAVIEDRESDLDKRAVALREKERALDKRAAKIRRQERIIARSRFGDGVYLVGTDIPPGSYVAPGSGGGCYWERGTRGGDIIQNHFGAGQVRAYVNRGELFSTQDCGTWRRG